MVADELAPPLSLTPSPAPNGLAIVVVEDYEMLCRQMVEHLQREGHVVYGVDCGEALDALLERFVPQILVLDLNLPFEDGLSIARRIRRTHPDMGIVMLSVRRTSDEREQGYIAGADIYLPKPLQPTELSAAIAALRRRLQPARAAQHWRLQVRAQLLRLPDGRVASLTAFETQALAALARAPEQKAHREVLVEALVAHGMSPTRDSLEVGFSRLRSKLLGLGVEQPLIKAVRGWGYQCCVELRLETPAPDEDTTGE